MSPWWNPLSWTKKTDDSQPATNPQPAYTPPPAPAPTMSPAESYTTSNPHVNPETVSSPAPEAPAPEPEVSTPEPEVSTPEASGPGMFTVRRQGESSLDGTQSLQVNVINAATGVPYTLREVELAFRDSLDLTRGYRPYANGAPVALDTVVTADQVYTWKEDTKSRG